MGKEFRRPTARQRGYVRHIGALATKLVAQSREGERQEVRLVTVMNHYLETTEHRPPWLVTFALGTQPQDHESIDVIAMSDIGPLYIQVKSSENGVRAFHEQRLRRHRDGKRCLIIAVVTINDKLADGEIVAHCLQELHRIYPLVQRHGRYLPRRQAASLS